MRIWPFDPRLNNEISLGYFHWLADQIGNVRMALAIRRSKRIDRFIALAAEDRPGEEILRSGERRIEDGRTPIV